MTLQKLNGGGGGGPSILLNPPKSDPLSQPDLVCPENGSDAESPGMLSSYIRPPIFENNFAGNLKQDLNIVAHSTPLYVLGAGAIAGGLGLGAHDFANAMGTTVGSGVLTLSQARTYAGIAVLYGSTFGGKNTASTIKKGIWDPQETPLIASEVQSGFGAALLGSSAWIAYANTKGWPISTTQSTVGGILGVAAVASAIKTNSMDDFGKGIQLGNVRDDLFTVADFTDSTRPKNFINIAKYWVATPVLGAAGGFVLYSILRSPYKYTQFNPVMSKVWSSLQIASGLAVAYGIGRNDSGHITGPVAGGIDSSKNTNGKFAEKIHVNQWLGLSGGLLILVGMRNFGGVVTDTLGSKIGGMNPAKALSAEAATALIENVFSAYGHPISSSHTASGAVIGTILASADKPPWFFLGEIGKSWLISIPVSALIAGGAYASYASVASIERDAPPVDDHGATPLELGAITAMRGDKLLHDAAKVATAIKETHIGKVITHIPVGAAGVGIAAAAVKAASDEGPRPAIAEGTKMVVESIPFAGGVAQSADAIYSLVKGKSWWTGLSVSKKESLANLGMGIGFTAMDFFGAGLVARAAKFLKIGGKAAAEAAIHIGAEAVAHSSDAIAHAGEAVAGAEKVGKTGFFNRLGEWLSGASRKEAAKEAERKELVDFSRNSMTEVYEKAAADVKLGPVSRTILKGPSISTLEKTAKKALGEINVHNHASKLLQRIELEVREAARNPKLADHMIDAVRGAFRKAVEKRNTTYLERAVLKVSKSAETRRMLKYVRHRVPEGVRLLGKSDAIDHFSHLFSSVGAKFDPRKHYYAMLEAAGTKLAKNFTNPWKKIPSMAFRVALEPVTMEMTTRGIRFALSKLTPRLKPVISIGRSIGEGLKETIYPWRSFKRSFQNGKRSGLPLTLVPS